MSRLPGPLKRGSRGVVIRTFSNERPRFLVPARGGFTSIERISQPSRDLSVGGAGRPARRKPLI